MEWRELLNSSILNAVVGILTVLITRWFTLKKDRAEINKMKEETETEKFSRELQFNSSLMDWNDKYMERVDDLERQLDELQLKYAKALNEIHSLQNDIKGLRSRNIELKEYSEKLEQQKTAQADLIAEMRTKLIVNEREIAILKERLEEITTKGKENV